MYDVLPESATDFQTRLGVNITSAPITWFGAGSQLSSFRVHDSGYHSQADADCYRSMLSRVNCEKASENNRAKVPANNSFCDTICKSNSERTCDSSCDNSANTGMDLLSEHLRSVDLTDGPDQAHSDRNNTPIYTDEAVIRTAFSQDSDGDTMLHSAIITLNEPLAIALINMAPSPRLLNIKNRLKQTPLHLAVLTQQTSLVRRLVVGGADITSPDGRGNTSLHIACQDGHTEMARALMEPVRFPETKQNAYDIPYQRVPQNLGLVNYEGWTVLHLAAARGHLGIVKMLIDKQADVNVSDVRSGRTILHMACEAGHLELVKMLLNCKRCNINARTYNNLTPFDLARDWGHTMITYELAVAGATLEEDDDMNEY